jgi:hypothetical protein
LDARAGSDLLQAIGCKAMVDLGSPGAGGLINIVLLPDRSFELDLKLLTLTLGIFLPLCGQIKFYKTRIHLTAVQAM